MKRRALVALNGAVLASVMLGGTALAGSVEPVPVDGNPVCSGAGGPSGESLGFDHGVKVDPPKAGTVEVGGGTVTISDVDTSVDPATFTWTSSGVTVLAVIVKGGDGANVYYYNPPASTTDSGLHAPNGFSHVNFCYNEEAPPPPELGSLTVTKEIPNVPEGFTGSFGVHVDCGGDGTFNRTIDFPNPGSVTIHDIAAGADCTVTETSGSNPPAGFTWGTVHIAGSPATIAADATAHVTVTNPLVEIPSGPSLGLDKSNTAPVVGGVHTATEGASVTFTLAYTVTGTVTDGVLTDVLPAGVTYTAGTASSDANFTFVNYDAGTRTLTWTAATATDTTGSLTYAVTINQGAAALTQPLINTATIDSEETGPDSDTSNVFVPAGPLAETAPPTDVAGTTDGNVSGGSMLFILLGLAGIVLAVAFVAPTPAAIRKRR